MEHVIGTSHFKSLIKSIVSPMSSACRSWVQDIILKGYVYFSAQKSQICLSNCCLKAKLKDCLVRAHVVCSIEYNPDKQRERKQEDVFCSLWFSIDVLGSTRELSQAQGGRGNPVPSPHDRPGFLSCFWDWQGGKAHHQGGEGMELRVSLCEE